jgi:hypothetical protein
VSDWRCADPQAFPAALAAAVGDAERLPLPPPARASTRAPAGGKPPPQACVRTVSQVQARPVDWLWRDYVPRHGITMLDGDPGLGAPRRR